MIYRILQFIMKQSLLVYYKDIKVEGKIDLDKNESYIIAATHPNSFLDAIILATILKQPLYFLARSDVFKKSWADFILRKLNLIPIYRLQEGLENLTKNDKTFSECYAILENQGSILIFAEGISLIDKKVRPLKKGLTRIGFGAEQKNQFKLKTHVVPIGINYQKAAQFGNNILISIQDKIALKPYQEAYQESANQCYINFNQTLLNSLKQASIETEDEEVFDSIAEQVENKHYKLAYLKNISERLAYLKSNRIEQWEMLNNAIHTIKKLQHKYGFGLAKSSYSLVDLILVIILSPLACLGYCFNRMPFAVANYISNKKVKLIEFYDSVKLVLGTLLWILWAALLSILFGLLLHPLFFLFPFALVISGKAYLLFKNKTATILSTFRYKRMKKSEAAQHSDSDYKKFKQAKKTLDELIFDAI
ncbi:MAG: hypothetical protein DWP98_13010 [Bacteroidetes bacterium]|nr:MAG: hypothetical protein DWP98_13010 [Bacteroidota bacterium]MBL1144619.1 hypothetical protein [Bacteroidota bacterium]